MNKKALLDYALYARKELETQIALSLNKLGIYEDHIADAHIVGEYCIIDGIQQSYPKRVYDIRRTITAIHLTNSTFKDVVEEFAYTWFNRIIAIRFMEVHDYFDHGFRVLTSRDGSYEPEILKNLLFVAKELHLEESVIRKYQDENKTDELYRYVLFKQCNELSEILPLLFDREASYLELVLPTNLLAQDSFIRKITDIPESDFMDDVEVVGWLYQFYNSVKKDEVFASKKTITKETLPAVTQLFTPDWIVRYMVENSLGRIWLESYPSSSLKNEMKYYVDDAEQEAEVQKKIDEIKYKNVDPCKLSIIEPCCGSGHILVYAFDLLYKMYVEQGYDKRTIPAHILGENLYGLDVDKRATQLAQFSLIMKARSIDPRFFNEDRYIKPMVFEIMDSQSLSKDYRDKMKNFGFSKEAIDLAYDIEKLFKDAKVIGSLLKIDKKDYYKLSSEITTIMDSTSPGLFDMYFYHHDLGLLKYLCQLANVMSIKYDVMVTNPPYCGSASLESEAKNYLLKNYNDSKTDLFAAFMETDFVKNCGFRAMINMQSWMFLSSYEKLRNKIALNEPLITMIHLGAHAFEAIGGEIVQTCTFISRKICNIKINSIYFRLINYDSQIKKEKAFLQKNKSDIFVKNISNILNIPGCPWAYWENDEILNYFINSKLIKDFGKTSKGLITGDNERFIRFWWEINYKKINFNASNNQQAKESKYKWFPCNKGGEYRRWFGNDEYVINWENDGYEVLKMAEKDKRHSQDYDTNNKFVPCVCWSSISSNRPSFRFKNNCLVDHAGMAYFPFERDNIYYLLGFLNSSIAQRYLKILSPTININAGEVDRLPVIEENVRAISEIVKKCIDIEKENWDNFEVSWNFINYNLTNIAKIENQFNDYIDRFNIMFSQLKNYENLIDKYFNENYKLSEIKEFDEKDISLRKSNKNEYITQLLSYFIGLIMGRFSLSHDGIAYAGGTFDNSKYGKYVDDDGILPIYDYIGIDGGLVDEICKLVKTIYGEEHYRENLDFIADALDRKIDESAEETINRYLNNDFYNDHLKTYQKRPIYWMLSSGKQGAFKCLIYLHRYNKNTLGLINSKYFLPRTAMYKAERERLQARLNSGQLDSRETKNVENELNKIIKCEEELLEYGQVLDYLANQYIELDLDDGVKANYVKFQGVSLQVNGATIKKDLLVPFGLEKK